jgi:hypothetical protein
MVGKKVFKDYVVTYYDKGNSMTYKAIVKANSASAAIKELKHMKGRSPGVKKVSAKLRK